MDNAENFYRSDGTTRDSVFTFGAQSKIGGFLFRYPWHSMAISLLLLGVVILAIGGDFEKSKRVFYVSVPFLIILTAIIKILSKNMCYKVSVNIKKNQISFFKMFNQGINYEKIEGVSITINKKCTIFINASKYVVLPQVFFEIVGFFPKDTKIEFVGHFGKFKEKDWKSSGINLELGTKIPILKS